MHFLIVAADENEQTDDSIDKGLWQWFFYSW